MAGGIPLVNEQNEVRDVISEPTLKMKTDCNAISNTNPRRWLLAKREASIPDSESTSDRWSVDHLFGDQGEVPTFIECKHSSNSELRKEVVTQMLNYAANGQTNWLAGRIKEAANETARSSGSDPDIVIFELIEPGYLDEDWLDEVVGAMGPRSSRVD